MAIRKRRRPAKARRLHPKPKARLTKARRPRATPTKRPGRAATARPKPKARRAKRAQSKPTRTRPAPPRGRNIFPPLDRLPATSAPVEETTPPPAPAPAIEEGSPQWQAYEMLIQKIESMYAPLAKMHRRLDREHMRGRRFSEILDRVFELYSVPPAYAGLVVRSYPGYEANDPETQQLREFLKQWMKRRREFRPQPGLGVAFDMDQDPPFNG